MRSSLSRMMFRAASVALAVAVLASPALASSKKKTQKAQKPDPNNPLAGLDSKQPDKQLFDKALYSLKKGRYDVARLELQALLNTYPDSEYQMRAKLAIGDSWYKEGGTAALTQAEAEYKDFITFFPNQPEAAEAQMKVANIYYLQMEKPDRDFTKTVHAEEEYRNMILQFPDSPLVPEAKQKLREVQEVLAQRQFEVASFYLGRENWPASIARFQTVADTYPLYSHSDDTLLGLGDAYMGEAKAIRGAKLPASAKEQLILTYENSAADAYTKAVMRYPLAPHTDDARDRLIAMNRPVPEPTKEALAQSEAEEQSHATVKLKTRALLLVSHRPSTVSSVRVGEPTMTEPPPTTAAMIDKQNIAAYNAAMHIDTGAPAAAKAATADAAASGEAVPRSDAPAAAAKPSLEDLPAGNDASATIISTGEAGAGAAAGTGKAAAAPADPGGLKAVGPADSTPLPAVEKPAAAPDQINDVKGQQQPAVAQTLPANGKKPNPKLDSSTDSSSKHKKKKGLKKLNPF